MVTTAQKQSFLQQIVPLANSYGSVFNIDPNLIVSQAALESNYGTSNIATTQNNFFGMKTASGAASGALDYQTYGSLSDSVRAFVTQLTSSPRYSGVVGASGSDAINAIAASGYAEDPSYGSKLTGIENSVAPVATSIASAVGGIDTSLSSSVSSVVGIGSSLVKDAAGAAEIGAGIFTGNPALLIAGVTSLFGGGSSGGPTGVLSDLVSWLKKLFSAHTAARFAAIIVGFILVAVALVYLTGTDKVVSTTIKEVGKGAAKAAVVAA